MSNPRIPDHQVHEVFLQRWSPRAFTGEVIDDATLFSFFEAARWSPSANNSQPWRFIYSKNGSASWDGLYALLNEGNQRWASKASALIVLVSKTTHLRNGEGEPSPLRNHAFDAGAAWASLALQAEHDGWRTHAIGGFDREKAREVLGVPEGFHVNVAIAIGRQADIATLSPELQAREKPNQRRPVSELVAEGRFAFAD